MSIALDAVYALVATATAPWWMRKSRAGWGERFGRIPALPVKSRPRLLIHAVSVGEVNLTQPLVERLLPNVEVVISATTDTGMARARELYAARCAVVRYPLDLSSGVRRFLDAVQPDAVALVELELWPNFLSACRARGVPVGVVNGRLSERSFARYRLGRALLKKHFAQLAFVGAQDETYAGRFRAMGAGRCVVAGNMKWDSAGANVDPSAAEQLARELGIDRTLPLIVGGSTEPGEPELLRSATPDGVQLLCAPRKTEWFDACAAALSPCVRRSSGKPGDRAVRFVLDTIGELRKAYALADVIVIGRSFGELFGSDPMEAAALGKPIVIGPRVADFRAAVEALEHAGAIVRATRESLAAELRGLLSDEARRRELGARALACVRANLGAAERHERLIREMMAIPHGPANNPAGARAE